MTKAIGKGYKTVAVNALIVLPPLLDYVVNNGGVFAPLLGGQGAVVVAALGVVNILLRTLTTTPIFQKE